MSRIKFDNNTSRWFKKHVDLQTTVVKCEHCGLYYKFVLGHKCKKGGAE